MLLLMMMILVGFHNLSLNISMVNLIILVKTFAFRMMCYLFVILDIHFDNIKLILIMPIILKSAQIVCSLSYAMLLGCCVNSTHLKIYILKVFD